MANITTNVLDTIISPAQSTTVEGALTLIETTLNPVFKTLTDEERATLLALDVDNKVFVDAAALEISNHAAILPAAISGAQLENDSTLFVQMNGLESRLVNILNKVRDTRRLAGHEAYAMALTTYTIFKSLAAVGVPDAKEAADRLGERFINNGGPTPDPSA